MPFYTTGAPLVCRQNDFACEFATEALTHVALTGHTKFQQRIVKVTVYEPEYKFTDKVPEVPEVPDADDKNES